MMCNFNEMSACASTSAYVFKLMSRTILDKLKLMAETFLRNIPLKSCCKCTYYN